MIEALDHLVLTVQNQDAARRFYVDGLGMRWIEFAEGRHALGFGVQKINLHYSNRTFEPKAACPTPGSADLCFLASVSLDEVERSMKAAGFNKIEGPVERTGAQTKLISLYFRDPDGNLIEISRPA